MVATALSPDHGDIVLDMPNSADAPTVPVPSPPSFASPGPAVRAIDADALFQMHRQFVSTPLPSQSMFPWLHGVDGTSDVQNYFFGIDHQYHHYYTGSFLADGPAAAATTTTTTLPLPEHRGLMFVHASDLDPGRLVGSVSPYEILQPAPRLEPTFGSQGSPPHGDTNTNDNTRFNSNGNQVDINNHPQIHHQYSNAPHHPHQQQQQQQQQHHHDASQGGAGRDSDWADDSISSSSLLSLSSTTSNTNNDDNNNNNNNNHNGGSTRSPKPSLLKSSFTNSLSEGINIRNFRIQVPRYALLSDIVLYSKDGDQDHALQELARQISIAQDEIWRSMKEQYSQMTIESRRQTFILTDSFAMFENKYPELVAVSSTGKASKNKVDFWEQEREQMSLLTRASEIAPGIWLGNNSDVPVVNSHSSSLATPVSPGPSYSSYFASIPLTLAQNSTNAGRHNASAMPSTPPPDEGEYPPLTPPSFNDHSSFQPSICVECRSGYNEATIMILDRIKNNVSGSAAPLPTKEIFHLECLGTLAANISAEAFPPSTSSLSSFARSDFVDIPSHHAMRRATAEGLVKGQQLSDPTLQAQMTHLLDMAFFIHSVTNPDTAQLSTNKSIINNNNNDNSSGSKRNHQVLIHCVDGYTESAILALCIIMIHYRISLAESFVKLQTDLGRSFFVYPNDAIVMLEVENQIWRRMLVEKTERETAARWKGAVSSPTSSSIASSAVPVPASQGGAFSTLFGGSGSSVTSSSGMSSLTSSLSSSSSSFFSSLLNMSNQPAQNQQQPYSLMEGITSMPDKDEELAIQRPFVRPGHEERFEWFYHPEFEGSFPSRILPFLYLGNLAHASNPGLLKSLGIQYVLSVGEEARGLNEDTRGEEAGQLDLGEDTAMEEGQSGKMAGKQGGEKATSSRFMVKLVDDMFDNGVDSLWRHLENCVAFVDEARRANARILIHCRVGVSRSATIVIAYLMAHYNLSLVDAYLMVRARRLSVIIQPNLLFMYELLQWEQRLRGQFDPMGWPGIAREVHSLNMYYIGN